MAPSPRGSARPVLSPVRASQLCGEARAFGQRPREPLRPAPQSASSRRAPRWCLHPPAGVNAGRAGAGVEGAVKLRGGPLPRGTSVLPLPGRPGRGAAKAFPLNGHALQHGGAPSTPFSRPCAIFVTTSARPRRHQSIRPLGRRPRRLGHRKKAHTHEKGRSIHWGGKGD